MICPICGKEFDKLCQDHHHASGQLRGKLCPACNCMIGFAREDERILLSAVEYLERWKKERIRTMPHWRIVKERKIREKFFKLVEKYGEKPFYGEEEIWG